MSLEEQPLGPELVGRLLTRLAKGEGVTCRFAGGGELHIERPQPFLGLYRERGGGGPVSCGRLLTEPSSYLLLAGESLAHPRGSDLVRSLCEALAEDLGAVLVLELWELPAGASHLAVPGSAPPLFQLAALGEASLAGTLAALERELKEIELGGAAAAVERAREPPQELVELARELARSERVSWLGVGVRPVYRCGGELFPQLFEELRTALRRPLAAGLASFVREHSKVSVPNVLHVFRQRLEPTVEAIDAELAEISRSFDFLVGLTPSNVEEAWESFYENGYRGDPPFVYRPLPFDPHAVKRRLHQLPIERVHDSTMALLLRQKQHELDLQIGMLRDLGSRHFFFGSLQLYGEVEDELGQLADQLLERLPQASVGEERDTVDAGTLAQRARAEIAWYAERWPEFRAEVTVREDIPPGMLVAGSRLLIGSATCVSEARVEPLMHHEVGTHLLTHGNGRDQALGLLSDGLAGYEAFQEGLAVLGEYLGGGLEPARLRTLAARVRACRSLIAGESFTELFTALVEQHGFPPAKAFRIAMRVHRGGGLTKDAIYLRGLSQVCEHLRRGGEVAPLYVGKIALVHVPLVEELLVRGLISPPHLLPRHLESEAARERLTRVRDGLSLLEIADSSPAGRTS